MWCRGSWGFAIPRSDLLFFPLLLPPLHAASTSCVWKPTQQLVSANQDRQHGPGLPALRATSTLVNIPPGPGATSASDDAADGSTCSPHLLHISFSRDHELQQRLALSQTCSTSFRERKQGSLPRRECKVDGKTRDVPNCQEGLPADARRPVQGPSYGKSLTDSITSNYTVTLCSHMLNGLVCSRIGGFAEARWGK